MDEIHSENAKVEWAQAYGLQQSGVTFVLVLVAVPSKGRSDELKYVLNVYTINPPPTHPSQKKRYAAVPYSLTFK